MQNEQLTDIVEKITAAESVLVALSKSPSLDEMAAAVGLTTMLDSMGKHVVAIYSSDPIPELNFLSPNKIFETSTNSLQDFVISLNKDKADHLRYKIEGDFVRVYVTPYKTTISEDDLEFSHGDVNVDLIIAINVTDSDNLDAALAKQSRLLRDTNIINISNAIPGRLGGIEWNSPEASSVCEMAASLITALDQKPSEDVATALLTGVMSSTERFSNNRTTPNTMALSASLMEAGANQQLIIKNIFPESEKKSEPEKAPLSGSVEIKDDEPATAEAPEPIVSPPTEESAPVELSPEQQLEQMISGDKPEAKTTSIMDELAAQVPAEPTPSEAPAVIEPAPIGEAPATPAPVPPAPAEEPTPTEKSAPAETITNEPLSGPQDIASIPVSKLTADTVYGKAEDRTTLQDGVIMPLHSLDIPKTAAASTPQETEVEETPKDYGAMMEEALAEPTVPAVEPVTGSLVTPVEPAQTAPVEPAAQNVPVAIPTANDSNVEIPPVAPPSPISSVEPATNPAIQAAPAVPVTPEAPAVEPVAPAEPVELPPPPAPVITDSAMPPTQIAPVEPAAPIDASAPTETTTPSLPPVQADESAAAGIPATSAGDATVNESEPVNPVIVQPLQDPTLVPPVQDPGAFKIPGA